MKCPRGPVLRIQKETTCHEALPSAPAGDLRHRPRRLRQAAQGGDGCGGNRRRNLENSADVVAYAPDSLQRARSLIDQMRTESKNRHYDKAKALATEATAAADAAVAEAQTNKEKAKSQAEELIAAVKKAIPETQKLLASAARVARAGIDKTARTAEIEGAKKALADAEAALAKGDYLVAVEKAGAAQKTLADMDSAISSAVQAATRKK